MAVRTEVGADAVLVVVDMQNVFGDPRSPWFTPRFDAVLATVAGLVRGFGPRVAFTRFIAPDVPAGAWVEYYRQWPFALQPPDSATYRLVDAFADAPRPTIDASTFGKWGPALAQRVGAAGEIVLAGVSSDCCVLSTALAAADAGVLVTVVADACAGVDDDSHRNALAVMGLYGPLVRVRTAEQVLAETGQ